MENQIKQYIAPHAELYDLIMQKAVKELGLPVKKKKPEKPHEAVIRKKQKKGRHHVPKSRRKGKTR